MQRSGEINDCPIPSMEESIINTDNIVNYDDLLHHYGLTYNSVEYYWQVGTMKSYQGWVLQLTTVAPKIPRLLQTILPTLIQENLVFRVIRDRQTAYSNLQGQLGFNFLNKIIIIYPTDNDRVLHLAKKLISLTNSFEGPSIPTSRWLGGTVYTEFITVDTAIINTQLHQKNLLAQSDVKWPFVELINKTTPKPKKLLNFTYYPIATIKKDAKGDVIKALYFKRIWHISTCIIKQGRKYMMFDDFKRDIRDRLKWQYQLHDQLHGKIPLPKVIDYFEEDGDTYLVIKFIHGTSATSILDKQYRGRIWYDLPYETKVLLTQYLIEIISIIGRLHDFGFVHRDITPENFLITKNHRIWMLDVELMWSLSLQSPNPPFQLGTPGFISPEQQMNKTPTVKDDIYAFGAFMITFFTNLPPIKFFYSSGEQLIKILSSFIENGPLIRTIAACLSENPLHRPDLDGIKHSLTLYSDRLQQRLNDATDTQILQYQGIDFSELKATIQSGLHGLVHPDMLTAQNHWVSNLKITETKLGNDQLGMIVYPGWHTGLSGPLWLLPIAKENGFDIESCMTAYKEGWNYISKFSAVSSQIDNSLYAGRAGIALALSAAFNNSLLCGNDVDFKPEGLISNSYTGITLEQGIAGQGIALLGSLHGMTDNYPKEILNSYINYLLNSQRPDGMWDLETTEDKKENLSLTLDKGISGIIWFLCHYWDYSPDCIVLASIGKALDYLIKSAHYKPEVGCKWPLIAKSKSKTHYSTNLGTPGIALALIKAFQVTKDRRCQELAEITLDLLPDKILLTDFSLAEGLAGIGEIYLEAYKAFKNQKWLARAEWIAQTFIHTFQYRTSKEGYWITKRSASITADLFQGNSGIIHFLMHYLYPDKLQHPLAPRLNRHTNK